MAQRQDLVPDGLDCCSVWPGGAHLPARGEQVECDGTADDLLHVRTDDSQLNHEPQDYTRNLRLTEKLLNRNRGLFTEHKCAQGILLGTNDADVRIDRHG